MKRQHSIELASLPGSRSEQSPEAGASVYHSLALIGIRLVYATPGIGKTHLASICPGMFLDADACLAARAERDFLYTESRRVIGQEGPIYRFGFFPASTSSPRTTAAPYLRKLFSSYPNKIVLSNFPFSCSELNECGLTPDNVVCVTLTSALDMLNRWSSRFGIIADITFDDALTYHRNEAEWMRALTPRYGVKLNWQCHLLDGLFYLDQTLRLATNNIITKAEQL